MRLPVSHHRSWFVPIGLLVAVAAIGVGAAGVAPAATSTKKYIAEIKQVSQTGYAFKLINDPTSTQTLGSANVSVPAGFSGVSVVGVTAPPGKTWTATPNGSLIELRASGTKSALAPKEFVTVAIDGSAGCAGSPYTWTTIVKQSNSFSGVPGNDFAGTSPTVSVIGSPARFQFAGIASPQVVGDAFGVTVTAKDACTNTAIFYTGGATLSGLLDNETEGTEPTYGALAFEGGNGVATASVKAVQSQLPAQLTASNGTASGLSEEFDVVDAFCDDPLDDKCEARHGDGTRVVAPVPPAGGTTKLSLSGPGSSFDCAGATYPNIGSHVMIEPDYPAGAPPIEIAIEWSLATALPGSRVVCITTSDGSTFVVPKCGRTPVAPCELDRRRVDDVMHVRFLIDPQDPGFDFG